MYPPPGHVPKHTYSVPSKFLIQTMVPAFLPIKRLEYRQNDHDDRDRFA